jgi:hypothetical protein
MTPDAAISLYPKMKESLLNRRPERIVRHIQRQSAKTIAENQGWYARDVFRLYSAILLSMKDNREWVAFIEHSDYHTHGENLLPPNVKPEGLDIFGKLFDPLVFRFEWIDNTLESPWKPWNWEIPFWSNDPDNSHYFFNPETMRCIANIEPNTSEQSRHGDELLFFGFKPELPTDLNFFEIAL